MTSVLEQDLITIKAACKLIPTRPHFGTVWRWIERGCRGHKLQSWLIGGQRFTTRSAILTFLEAINGESPSVKSSTPKQRQRAIDQAEKELAELGL